MATLEQLSTALVNADKAGDVEAATALAQEIKRLRAAPAEESQQSQDLRSQLSDASNSLAVDRTDGIGRDVDSFMRGAADMASFGLADEIAAVGGALTGVGGEFGEYSRNLRRERIKQDQRDNLDPVASTAGRIAGGVGTGVGLAKGGVSLTGRLAPTASLGARVGAGAAEGAAYGGAYGFGSGEGGRDRFADAVGGAVMGGAIGGAVPAIAAGVKAGTKPVRDAIFARTNPGGYAEQKIAERLANSNQTVGEVAGKMRDGLSIADAGGKSMRDLLRTTANIPGKAKDRVASQLALRQMGQGDRLKDAVARTFADPDGYLAAKDDIAAAAKRLAEPLYREAYSTPVHYSETLEGILATPAGRTALGRAEHLAANEQIPFQQLFINIADDGTATARRVPDARAWDYIKRGFDDMIDAQTDSITKKMTNEGRILTTLKNKMLSEIDRVNPAYKAARQAWSGQQQLDSALEFGRTAMTLSPEAVKRTLAEMGQAEKAAARAGAAEWIRNSIDQRNFTHNAILKFFSNRQQVKNLRALFDNDEQFATFRKAIFAEARKRSTYEAVKGNSTTASQLADMFETGGQGGAGLQAARTAAAGSPVTATLQYIGSRMKMLGGLTPEVADEIAKRLMTADSAKVRMVANELMRLERQQLTAAQKSQMVQFILSRALTAPATSSLSAS